MEHVQPTRRSTLRPIPAAAATATALPLAWWLGSSPTLYYVLISAVVLWFVARQFHFGLRQKRFHGSRLEARDGDLIQRAPNGEAIARIDLRQSFEYRIIEEGGDFAIYCLYQQNARLEFSSTTSGAAEVVADVLGLSWPHIDQTGISA